MWLYGLTLAPLLACVVHSAQIHEPLDCREPSESSGNIEACARPVDDIVAIVPGSSYIANVECKDCPYLKETWGADHEPLRVDQKLFLNITLAHDNRTVLLNNAPIYPLPTLPTPPEFWVPQRPSNFSNADLASGLTCANPYCHGSEVGADCKDWCSDSRLSSLQIDYFYTVQRVDYQDKKKEAGTQYWEIALDVIGGQHRLWRPHWKLDNKSQKMLWVLISGKESKTGSPQGPLDTGSSSDLFGPLGEEDKVYDYQIIDMRLQGRTYKFPAKKALGIWRSIGRFLGTDVWQEEGRRFLYLNEEWGQYGKLGTLRNSFGLFIHWTHWTLFIIIIPSIIAAMVVVFSTYKLFFWVQQQKQLMNWDGIEDLWDRLRSDSTLEEGDVLLDSAYRDEPEEGGSSRSPRYTDEPSTMKPLPSKPLPEKPLPAVPLIDA